MLPSWGEPEHILKGLAPRLYSISVSELFSNICLENFSGYWGCPSGFQQHGTFCYRSDLPDADFDTQKTACANKGGYLATINSQQESTQAFAHITGKSILQTVA